MSRGAFFGVEGLLWIFYLVLTGVIIVAFVVVPAGIIDRGVDTLHVEGVVLAERALSRVQAFSPSVGSLDVLAVVSNSSFPVVASSDYRAIKVSVADKSFFVNKAYFERSEWLVPFGVVKYERSRVVGATPVNVVVLLDKGGSQ